MTGDDIEATAASTDERRRVRLARIEAEQAHGEASVERYGREHVRPTFAVLGHAAGKRRRR
jgi:hypothetical protein